MRWQLEVTFQEMRRHLGFESQRQWSELAIQRTTPALLGLFSLVTLFAHLQMRRAGGHLSASGGLVPQGSSYLRRCFGAGEEGAMGQGADFLRLARGERHGQSPAGIC
jgi:hypothetical protein